MAERPIGPGTLLAGRFVLEDLLNESEGARFYRAHDRVLARDVAVHVVSADDERSAALLSAARTSATVSDGHLLRVLDAATEDGVTYVVNEWGTGMSLDKLLSEGPLSPRRAAWVVKEVAEAVSTAHRVGIAHGRLVPENVVVTDSGSVKLIGFVIDAVLRGREQQRTADGTLLGEHEADVLNLGALLYAGLVARWPGTAGSRLPAAPTEHGRWLRPRQVRAGVPRSLDAICERVLHREANHSAVPIETAHEVYAALSDFIGDPTAAMPTDRLGTGPLGTVPAVGAADPDATQVGAPVFYDADSGVGWMQGAAPRGVPGEDHPTSPGSPEDPEATQLSGPLSEPSGSTPPPPPPPFPEPEERPLFADSPRRPAPQADPVQPPFSRSRTGLPPAWGPDADEPVEETGELHQRGWEPDRPGRSWMRLALTIGGALVLVVAVILAFNLGRGSLPGSDQTADPGSPEAPAEPQPVEITAVSDFDPGGDPPEENPDTAALAIDDDPTTAWRTSTYFDPIDLLKEGVGLRVDLGEATEVSEVEVTFLGSPTAVEVMAAPEDAEAPTSTEGLTVVARDDDAGESTVLELEEPTTARYLVVWLTSLPPVEGGFRGQVAEIDVRS